MRPPPRAAQPGPSQTDRSLFQALFERTLDAVVVLDGERRLVDVNPAACELFAMAPAQLVGRPLRDLLGRGGDLDSPAGERLIAGGPGGGQAAILTASGLEVPCQYWAASFSPGRHLAVFRDIRERQDAEREIFASAEFLRRVIESSNDCIKVLDLDARLLSMSEGGRRLLEIDQLDRFIGTSWLDLWPAAERSHAAEAVARARRGEASVFLGYGPTVRGNHRWWETAVAPINGADGRPERILAVTRDVTERQRAKEELAFLSRATQSLAASLDYDETLRRIVELPVPYLADLAVIDVAAEGEVKRVAWSDAARSLRDRLGAAQGFRPALDALHSFVANVLHPGPQLVDDVTDEWLRGVATSPAHHEFLRSLGLRSVIVLPLTDPGRVTTGILSLATTSSGRRYAPGHLALAEQYSIRAVLALQNARLYDGACRAKEEAAAASRVKDEFLAMLAHELRNPLGAVVNAIETLNVIGAPAPEAVKVRGMIRRQTDQLAALVDDLLDVARIGQGKLELQLQPVDLRTIVKLAFEGDRHRLEARRQAATLDLPDEPMVVNGDPVRLRQIVVNLLNNASKYTPPGGVLTASVRAEGSDVVLRVRDNGIGIRRDKLATIFELFAQERPTAGRTEGGLGVGLALVKRLTDLLGGTVEAHSDGEGAGSEFVVRLPRVTAAVREPAPAAARAVPAPRERILVIEDNMDARDLLAMSLQLAGHEVLGAGSGREGVELASAHRPGCVIVDIGLPDQSGHVVGRRLRELLGADVVLVAFSGYGQPEDRERSREAGFDAHVVKPVAPQELMTLLAEHSRRRAGPAGAGARSGS